MSLCRMVGFGCVISRAILVYNYTLPIDRIIQPGLQIKIALFTIVASMGSKLQVDPLSDGHEFLLWDMTDCIEQHLPLHL